MKFEKNTDELFTEKNIGQNIKEQLNLFIYNQL
jgi:hypothetical protein